VLISGTGSLPVVPPGRRPGSRPGRGDV